MLIKKIDELKNFGIFGNYKTDQNVAEFVRYNLFYGCNGSGKSTLAEFFRTLGVKLSQSNLKTLTLQ